MLLERAFHNCVHLCNRQHRQLSSFKFKLTWETAPGKMRVITFVTDASFKRIFAFPPTEQAQKGGDPRVQGLQGLQAAGATRRGKGKDLTSRQFTR